MAPAIQWNKLKKIIVSRNPLKNLKCLDQKSLKNLRNDHGKSLLHVAAKHASLAVNKYLLEAGLEINLKDNKNGRDPLICALLRNDSETKKIVKLLVNSGADISWTDIVIGRRAHVLFHDKKNLAALLCKTLKKHEGSFQAAANHLMKNGWSLDNIAYLQNENMTSCALIGDPILGQNYNRLKDAIAQQDLPQVAELIKLVSHSKRILSWALQKTLKLSTPESAIIVKLLYEHGAPMAGFIGDENTPLERALMSCNIHGLWKLLDCGAEFDNFMIHEIIKKCSRQFVFLTLMGGNINSPFEPKENEFFQDCIRLLVEYRGAGNNLHLIRELPTNFESFGTLGHLRAEYISMIRHFSENDIFTYTYFNLYTADFESLEYDQECSNELEKIRNFQMEENLSLRDLLLKNIDEIIPLTRNHSVMSKIMSDCLIQEFPHYGKNLQFKVGKALEKRLLIDHAIEVLSICLPAVGLSQLVLEKIVYFLNDPCLLNLE